MKEKILRFNLYFGFSLFLFSSFLIILKLAFMKTWFFSFAWWSFILVMDSINFRKTKESPLFESGRTFLFTAYISVFVWLVFELFNLRLGNWSYHDLPRSSMLRWLGYFVAFASVVPAMREISFFFINIFKRKRISWFRIRGTPALRHLSLSLGVACIFLPFFWPSLFFPLIWLCFILLLEPLNYRLKIGSFLRDVENNDWSRFWSWVLTGLIAGFLWEIWNFWAGSRWEYSLPYLNFWKIFQMPVFGYTGFLPFALEVFVLYQILAFLYEKIQKKILLKSLVITGLLLFYLGSFYLIDTFTLVR